MSMRHATTDISPWSATRSTRWIRTSTVARAGAASEPELRDRLRARARRVPGTSGWLYQPANRAPRRNTSYSPERPMSAAMRRRRRARSVAARSFRAHSCSPSPQGPAPAPRHGGDEPPPTWAMATSRSRRSAGTGLASYRRGVASKDRKPRPRATVVRVGDLGARSRTPLEAQAEGDRKRAVARTRNRWDSSW